MSIKGWRAMLLSAVAGAAAWAGIVAGASALLAGSDTVRVELDCPTEDSCRADYRDGAWYVTRMVP